MTNTILLPLQVSSAAEGFPAAFRFLWIPLMAALVSALTAFWVSSRTIRANQDIARKRATLDLIERSVSTEYYLLIYSTFREVLDSPSGFEQITDPQMPALVEQRRKVIAFLNQYELIAIGIEQGILDEELYRDYMRGTVVRHWARAEGLVNHLRADTPDSRAPKAFEKFEALALKWETAKEAERRTG
ncbi:hypothetical protein Jann_0614 [Jannaschia sp. CCS1]|nr:hypothetical protein Jann_0614 [Jannaschia sp. CCS1]